MTNSWKILAWAALPVFLALTWNYLDASPSLFLYDAVQSLVPRDNRFHYLQNKTVWITGASSGIGAELTCQIFRSEAKHVIISARRSDSLKKVADECQLRSPTSPTQISILPFDAADPQATESTVRAAIEQSSNNIDILFLNAGMYQVQPALETTIEQTRRIMRVNFESPVEIAQLVLKLDGWKERGYGHIVCVASIMSRGGHSLASSYAASKHALRGYFHSLSTEEFEWLRVCTVLPGAVANPNFWSALDGNNNTNTIRADEGGFLNVKRCVHLILTGITGPRILSFEMWIAKAPGLLWATLSAYTPNLFHLSIHIFGMARMAIWNQSDGTYDCLSIPAFVRVLWEKFV